MSLWYINNDKHALLKYIMDFQVQKKRVVVGNGCEEYDAFVCKRT